MKVFTIIETVIGPLLAARVPGGPVTDVRFARDGRVSLPPSDWSQDDRAFRDLREQLAAYFGGELRDFDLDLAPAGTAFQQSVWSALRTIPFGETRSYLDIATTIGKPSACRAVGAANGANPIPIVIPCHRVIGSGGSLTGFGGGLDVKRRLLQLESAPVGAVNMAFEFAPGS